MKTLFALFIFLFLFSKYKDTILTIEIYICLFSVWTQSAPFNKIKHDIQENVDSNESYSCHSSRCQLTGQDIQKRNNGVRKNLIPLNKI